MPYRSFTDVMEKLFVFEKRLEIGPFVESTSESTAAAHQEMNAGISFSIVSTLADTQACLYLADTRVCLHDSLLCLKGQPITSDASYVGYTSC